jgi:hypothetical protein
VKSLDLTTRFPGTDVRAVLGHLTFDELQAISYSIHREKAPIYTMGSPDPQAFSGAKRGVAGALIWINFDRHAAGDRFRIQGSDFLKGLLWLQARERPLFSDPRITLLEVVEIKKFGGAV